MLRTPSLFRFATNKLGAQGQLDSSLADILS